MPSSALKKKWVIEIIEALASGEFEGFSAFLGKEGLTSHILSAYFIFFNDTATTEIYTLSLHDALPILPDRAVRRACSPISCVAPGESPGNFEPPLRGRHDCREVRANSGGLLLLTRGGKESGDAVRKGRRNPGATQGLLPRTAETTAE